MKNPIFSLVALALVLISGSAWAIDPTRPLTDHFPPPIGVTPGGPESSESPDGAAPTFEDQLMELVNQERWNNGELAPYKRVDALDSSSDLHSQNMAVRNFVMHCDPDTLTFPWDRMVAVGYFWSSAAENIAWSAPTPQDVLAGWMASSGHRGNILSTSFREMGNGYFYQSSDNGTIRRTTNSSSCTPNTTTTGPFHHYWTQNFGYRSGIYPVVIDREATLTDARDVDLYLWGSFAEMRIRNENGTWTAWQPFSSDVAWQLSAGNGTKTVNVEMRTGGNTNAASDTIILEGVSDEIFSDGFELGNTNGWSSATP